MKRLLLSLLFIVTAAHAQAATKYVHSLCANGTTTYNALGNSGAGSCTGGNTTSYSTINNALPTLAAGDFLYIRAGTYNEAIDTNYTAINGGTSWANAPVIAAYPGATVIVMPTRGDESVVNLPSTSGLSPKLQYVIFNDIIFDGSNNDASVVAVGVNFIRFNGVTIRNASTSKNGGQVFAPSNGVEFVNCKSHSNAESKDEDNQTGYGFYLSGTNTIVDNCDIYDNGAYGVHYYDTGSHAVSNNVVKNSRIWGNNRIGSGPYQVILSSGSNNAAYNNLIYSPAGSEIVGGVQIDYDCDNCRVYNNTIFGHSGYGIAINLNGAGSDGTLVRNNIIWSNTLGSIIDQGTNTSQSFNLCTSGCTGTGAKNGQDPRFISSTDFRLQSTSPAINAGSNTVCPATDINGIARPVGGTCDMGAYEFGGTASSPIVLITSPSATGSYSAVTTPITTIAGSATSGVALASVTWSNDRGGSGTATGTTTWSIASLTLQTGVNVITVTVTDVNGLTGQATLAITYGEAALVGAWSCDEGSGSSVADASGNGNTGTFTAPSWTAGKFGSACAFDAPAAVVTVGDSASLDVTGGLTLSGWVYPTLQTDAWRALFAKDGSYWLFASSSAQCGVSAPYGGFYSGSYWSTCYGTLLPLNTWTFVAMRFDGAQLQLLTGATPENLTVRSSIDVSAPIIANASSLRIGNSGNTEPFIGLLDNIRAHNYGRSTVAGSGSCGSSQTTGLVYSQLQCDMITPINPNAPVILNLGTGTVSLQLGPGVILQMGAQ